MKKETIIIIALTIIGGILRFHNLGERPLWVDESLAGLWIKENGLVMQEFPYIILGKGLWALGLQSEFWLRSISALAGTLTIPAIYVVLEKRKLTAALIVAVFPLFIFWSQMARPYALAGLFIVLGWRWFWFYVPALLTTSTALVGVKFWKIKLLPLAAVVGTGLVTFFIRPDAGRFTGSDDVFVMMSYSSRWYYIPALAVLLYLFGVIVPYFERRRIIPGKKSQTGKRVYIQHKGSNALHLIKEEKIER